MYVQSNCTDEEFAISSITFHITLTITHLHRTILRINSTHSMIRFYFAHNFQEKRKHHEKKQRKSRKGGSLFVSYLLYFFHLVKDFLLNLFCKWYWSNQRLCPSLSRDENFLTLSAVDLARMIRTKEISSYKLVECYINRINKVKQNHNR